MRQSLKHYKTLINNLDEIENLNKRYHYSNIPYTTTEIRTTNIYNLMTPLNSERNTINY